jgi:peptidoglycan hydrolase-like protein with peptidoglycan-binding domain
MSVTSGKLWTTPQANTVGGKFWNTPQTVLQPWQKSDWKPTQSQMNGFYNRLKQGLTLKQGSQGLDVALLQYRLKQFVEQRTFGLTQIKVDGQFGSGTESVVKAFQRFINDNFLFEGRSKKIDVNGIVDKNIVLHLENAFLQPRQGRKN